MAFNIVLDIQLRGPSSAQVAGIVNQIQGQLGSIRGQVNVQVSGSGVTAINQLNQAVNTLNASIQTANANLGGLNNVAANTAQRTNAAINPIIGLGNAATTTAANIKLINIAATEATDIVGKFGEQSALATRRFLAFSVAAGTLISAFVGIKNGLSEGVQFENQLNRIGQISGDSRNSLHELGTEISQLAIRYGVSSRELSQAALTLRQSGHTLEQTRTALNSLAQTGNSPVFSGITRGAEGAIVTMRQFGLGVNDLQRSLSSISAVAAQFGVSATDIQEGISRAGGTFQTLGGNLNQFIALFTAVKNTTRESSDAIGAGLRIIFSTLHSQETINALREINVELRYSREEAAGLGNLRLENTFIPPLAAIQRISEALRRLPTNSPEYNRIVNAIGGQREIARVLPLIQQTGLQNRILDVANNSGANLANQAARAQESLQVQATRTFEKFQELFNLVARNDAFQSFASALLGIAGGLAQILKYLTPVLPLLTTLAGIKIASSAVGYFTSFAGQLSNPRGRSYSQGGFAEGGPSYLSPGETVKLPDGRMKVVPNMPAFSFSQRSGNSDSVYTPDLPRGSYVYTQGQTQNLGRYAEGENFQGGLREGVNKRANNIKLDRETIKNIPSTFPYLINQLFPHINDNLVVLDEHMVLPKPSRMLTIEDVSDYQDKISPHTIAPLIKQIKRPVFDDILLNNYNLLSIESRQHIDSLGYIANTSVENREKGLIVPFRGISYSSLFPTINRISPKAASIYRQGSASDTLPWQITADYLEEHLSGSKQVKAYGEEDFQKLLVKLREQKFAKGGLSKFEFGDKTEEGLAKSILEGDTSAIYPYHDYISERGNQHDQLLASAIRYAYINKGRKDIGQAKIEVHGSFTDLENKALKRFYKDSQGYNNSLSLPSTVGLWGVGRHLESSYLKSRTLQPTIGYGRDDLRSFHYTEQRGFLHLRQEPTKGFEEPVYIPADFPLLISPFDKQLILPNTTFLHRNDTQHNYLQPRNISNIETPNDILRNRLPIHSIIQHDNQSAFVNVDNEDKYLASILPYFLSQNKDINSTHLTYRGNDNSLKRREHVETDYIDLIMKVMGYNISDKQNSVYGKRYNRTETKSFAYGGLPKFSDDGIFRPTNSMYVSSYIDKIVPPLKFFENMSIEKKIQAEEQYNSRRNQQLEFINDIVNAQLPKYGKYNFLQILRDSEELPSIVGSNKKGGQVKLGEKYLDKEIALQNIFGTFQNQRIKPYKSDELPIQGIGELGLQKKQFGLGDSFDEPTYHGLFPNALDFAYHDTVRDYVASSHKFNISLYQGKELSQEEAERNKILEGIIRQHGSLPQDLTLYRGISSWDEHDLLAQFLSPRLGVIHESSKLIKPSTYTHKGFLSTAFNLRDANFFGKIIAKIKAHKGAPGLGINPMESEVLFPPNQQLLITGFQYPFFDMKLLGENLEHHALGTIGPISNPLSQKAIEKIIEEQKLFSKLDSTKTEIPKFAGGEDFTKEKNKLIKQALDELDQRKQESQPRDFREHLYDWAQAAKSGIGNFGASIFPSVSRGLGRIGSFIGNSFIGRAFSRFRGFAESTQKPVEGLLGQISETLPDITKIPVELFDPEKKKKNGLDKLEEVFDDLEEIKEPKEYISGYANSAYKEAAMYANLKNALEPLRNLGIPNPLTADLTNNPLLRAALLKNPQDIGKIHTQLQASLVHSSEADKPEVEKLIRDKIAQLSSLQKEFGAYQQSKALPFTDVEEVTKLKPQNYRKRGAAAQNIQAALAQLIGGSTPKEVLEHFTEQGYATSTVQKYLAAARKQLPQNAYQARILGSQLPQEAFGGLPRFTIGDQFELPLTKLPSIQQFGIEQARIKLAQQLIARYPLQIPEGLSEQEKYKKEQLYKQSMVEILARQIAEQRPDLDYSENTLRKTINAALKSNTLFDINPTISTPTISQPSVTLLSDSLREINKLGTNKQKINQPPYPMSKAKLSNLPIQIARQKAKIEHEQSLITPITQEYFIHSHDDTFEIKPDNIGHSNTDFDIQSVLNQKEPLSILSLAPHQLEQKAAYEQLLGEIASNPIGNEKEQQQRFSRVFDALQYSQRPIVTSETLNTEPFSSLSNDNDPILLLEKLRAEKLRQRPFFAEQSKTQTEGFGLNTFNLPDNLIYQVPNLSLLGKIIKSGISKTFNFTSNKITNLKPNILSILDKLSSQENNKQEFEVNLSNISKILKKFNKKAKEAGYDIDFRKLSQYKIVDDINLNGNNSEFYGAFFPRKNNKRDIIALNKSTITSYQELQDTIAHELGHNIDFIFGNRKKYESKRKGSLTYNIGKKYIESNGVNDEYYNNPKEGFAEWFSNYIQHTNLSKHKDINKSILGSLKLAGYSQGGLPKYSSGTQYWQPPSDRIAKVPGPRIFEDNTLTTLEPNTFILRRSVSDNPIVQNAFGQLNNMGYASGGNIGSTPNAWIMPHEYTIPPDKTRLIGAHILHNLNSTGNPEQLVNRVNYLTGQKGYATGGSYLPSYAPGDIALNQYSQLNQIVGSGSSANTLLTKLEEFYRRKIDVEQKDLTVAERQLLLDQQLASIQTNLLTLKQQELRNQATQADFNILQNKLKSGGVLAPHQEDYYKALIQERQQYVENQEKIRNAYKVKTDVRTGEVQSVGGEGIDAGLWGEIFGKGTNKQRLSAIAKGLSRIGAVGGSYIGYGISEISGIKNAEEAVRFGKTGTYATAQGFSQASIYGGIGGELGGIFGPAGTGVGTAIGVGIGAIKGVTDANRETQIAQFGLNIERLNTSFNTLISTVERLGGRFSETQLREVNTLGSQVIENANNQYNLQRNTPGLLGNVFGLASDFQGELGTGQTSYSRSLSRAFARNVIYAPYLGFDQEYLQRTESTQQRQNRIQLLSQNSQQVSQTIGRGIEGLIANSLNENRNISNEDLRRRITGQFGNRGRSGISNLEFYVRSQNFTGENPIEEYFNSSTFRSQRIAIQSQQVLSGQNSQTSQLIFGFKQFTDALQNTASAMEEFSGRINNLVSTTLGGNQQGRLTISTDILNRPQNTPEYNRVVQQATSNLPESSARLFRQNASLIGRIGSVGADALQEYLRHIPEGAGSVTDNQENLIQILRRRTGVSDTNSTENRIITEVVRRVTATATSNRSLYQTNTVAAERLFQNEVREFNQAPLELAQAQERISNNIIQAQNQILQLELRRVEYLQRTADTEEHFSRLSAEQTSIRQFGGTFGATSLLTERQFNSGFYQTINERGRGLVGGDVTENTNVTEIGQRARQALEEYNTAAERRNTSLTPEDIESANRLFNTFNRLRGILELFGRSTERLSEYYNNQLHAVNAERGNRIEGQLRYILGSNEERIDLIRGRSLRDYIVNQGNQNSQQIAFNNLGLPSQQILVRYLQTFGQTRVNEQQTHGDLLNQLVGGQIPELNEVNRRQQELIDRLGEASTNQANANRELASLTNVSREIVQQENNVRLRENTEALRNRTEQLARREQLDRPNTTGPSPYNLSTNQIQDLLPGRTTLQGRNANSFLLAALRRENGANFGEQELLQQLSTPEGIRSARASVGRYYTTELLSLGGNNQQVNFSNRVIQAALLRIEALANEQRNRGAIQGASNTYNFLQNSVESIINNLGNIFGFASGGPVYAYAGKELLDKNFWKPQGTDTIPAMLTEGEYVINRESTQANYNLIKRINQSRRPLTHEDVLGSLLEISPSNEQTQQLSRPSYSWIPSSMLDSEYWSQRKHQTNLQGSGQRQHQTNLQGSGQRQHQTNLQGSGQRQHQMDLQGSGQRQHQMDLQEDVLGSLLETSPSSEQTQQLSRPSYSWIPSSMLDSEYWSQRQHQMDLQGRRNGGLIYRQRGGQLPLLPPEIGNIIPNGGGLPLRNTSNRLINNGIGEVQLEQQADTNRRWMRSLGGEQRLYERVNGEWLPVDRQPRVRVSSVSFNGENNNNQPWNWNQVGNQGALPGNFGTFPFFTPGNFAPFNPFIFNNYNPAPFFPYQNFGYNNNQIVASAFPQWNQTVASAFGPIMPYPNSAGYYNYRQPSRYRRVASWSSFGGPIYRQVGGDGVVRVPVNPFEARRLEEQEELGRIEARNRREFLLGLPQPEVPTIDFRVRPGLLGGPEQEQGQAEREQRLRDSIIRRSLSGQDLRYIRTNQGLQRIDDEGNLIIRQATPQQQQQQINQFWRFNQQGQQQQGFNWNNIGNVGAAPNNFGVFPTFVPGNFQPFAFNNFIQPNFFPYQNYNYQPRFAETPRSYAPRRLDYIYSRRRTNNLQPTNENNGPSPLRMNATDFAWFQAQRLRNQSNGGPIYRQRGGQLPLLPPEIGNIIPNIMQERENHELERRNRLFFNFVAATDPNSISAIQFALNNSPQLAGRPGSQEAYMQMLARRFQHQQFNNLNNQSILLTNQLGGASAIHQRQLSADTLGRVIQRNSDFLTYQPLFTYQIEDVRGGLFRRNQNPQVNDSYQQSILRYLHNQRRGFATGGEVYGPEGTDIIPAMLSRGEFVFNRRATENIGARNLENIQRMASGGIAGGQSTSGGKGNIGGFVLGGASELTNALTNFALNNNTLIDALNSFSNRNNELVEALRGMPHSITMQGTHKVEVVVNGTTAFAEMENSFKELVLAEIENAINKMIKDKFPEHSI